MRNLLIILIVFSWCSILPAQKIDTADTYKMSKKAYDYIMEAVAVMKTHSYKSDSLDWNSIARNMLEKARGAQLPKETHEAIAHGVKLLGDHHSSFTPKKKPASPDGTRARSRGPRIDYLLPSGRILKGGIGYIWVPYCMQQPTEELLHFARILHELIGAIERYEPLGWIVDLRDNGGGNMWPMELGLGPLSGEGILFHIVKPTERMTMSYQEETVKLENNGEEVYSLSLGVVPAKIKNPKAPIAVLIGPDTGSSGESAVVSFLGKSNVQTFGLPTYGATTSIRHYELSDGSTLNLAVALFADRLDTQYSGAILPDERVEFDTFDSMRVPGKDDPVVKAATEWIQKKADEKTGDQK